MIPYSLHVAIILAICLIFYQLFLHKETYYRLNRIVLLSCLLLAFILPLIPVPQKYSLRHESEIIVANTPLIEEEPILATSNLAVVQKSPIAETIEKTEVEKVPLTERLIKWTFWIYWCGVAVLGVNLLIQVLVLLYQAYRKPVIKDGIYRIVELDGNKAPCSFGNTIFINPSKYDWETYNQILIHEKVHIQQGHSFDLIFAELVLVVQWFNPFAWLYRKALESNLEFLADDSVLHDYKVEMEGYQLSLLKVAVPNQSMNITTNYNQSLLKKRIVMMNAKKSNVHTMWKYFIMVPLMAILLAGLNKPVAMSSIPSIEPNVNNGLMMSAAKGLWFATIKDDKVQIEFKSDDDMDRNYRWSNSTTFNLSEFSVLPKDNKADFTVTREAGTVTFNGKFDDDQGFGRFKFTPNKEYSSFLAFKGIEEMKDEEYISFFMMDVKKQYIQFLNDNGFKNLSKGQIISMSAFKIDAEYINYWKKLGYIDITANNLVSLKSMKIDSVYVNDIRKAGYTDLTVQQLISFKAQKITGSYINSLQKATLRKPIPGSTEPAPQVEKPTPSDIISAKAMKVDTNYMAAVRDAGFHDLRPRTIYTLKSQNITPEFIKSFQDIGLKDIPFNTLSTFKNQNITAAYIKSFMDIGLKDVPYNTLYAFKSQDITPEFIKSYMDIGLKNVPYTTLYTFKSQGMTAAYIKSFMEIGLKDLPYNTLYTFKSQGITPAYIKSFQDIGLKDIPYNTLYAFKSQGITPEFIKGFMELGYKNMAYSQYYSLKSQGITPEYIAEMKQKGFDSKDVSKYIQLKSFNGAKNK